MKPPPFLLGAALLFWGWQSDLLSMGAIMALLVESACVIHRRWEFSDEDFAHVWQFCSLVFLATAIYAFTANEGPSAFGGLFQEPTLSQQRRAGVASAKTAAAMFRWLPMIFFPFLAAQTYSLRESIPLTTVSLIVRRRWRRAIARGLPVPPERNVHVGFPYFAGTLLAASVHPAEDLSFFWGVCVLLGWALWSRRPQRFGLITWGVTFAAAIAIGFFGQQGIGNLQGYLERLNPQWLSRLLHRGTDPTRSRTALGTIGELKLSGEIVIRLRSHPGSPPPTYLREAAYRAYRTPVWYVGGRRDSFEGNLLEDTPNSRSWKLIDEIKTNMSSVNIACPLPGGEALLPLPMGASWLENLSAYVLKKNGLGSVLAEGPGLVKFDAHFGPGTTVDGLPVEEDRHVVPEEELAALDEVVRELNLPGHSSARVVMQALQKYFASRFTYSTWQDAPRRSSTNATPLARFLRETHRGHCEYFATATTLLLRRHYIPARYAVGYFVHEHVGEKYVVRERDAHAWTLVWDEQDQKWVDFDTTPASWVEEEGKLKSAFQWLSDFWSGIKFEFAKFRWGQSRIREYLLFLIVPGLLVLFYQIFFKRRQQRSKPAIAGALARGWPGRDSEFYALESALAARGFARRPGETLADWLERATRSITFAEVRGPLRQLLWLHYRLRFDPLGLDDADRETLRQDARSCLEKLEVAEPASRV